MVLESWCGSRRKVQAVSGAIPGNSQLGVAGITNSREGGYGGPGGLEFHQTRVEDDPRGLVLHQGGVGVVLEAWYYTRAVWERSWRPGITQGRCRGGLGGLVSHQGDAGGVLEAWYYTRAVQGWSWRPGIPPGRCRRGPRGLVLHQGGWDRCGPRGNDWLDSNGC